MTAIDPTREMRQAAAEDRLGDVVKFNWEMISAGGDEVAGVGLEVLVLDRDGRITTDYQFIESWRPPGPLAALRVLAQSWLVWVMPLVSLSRLV